MLTALLTIDTAALPMVQLLNKMPQIEAPSNYKDPVKIQAYIEAAKLKWVCQAANQADTGQLVGYSMSLSAEITDNPSTTAVVESLSVDDEVRLLKQLYRQLRSVDMTIVTERSVTNFILRRAVMHGVKDLVTWAYDNWYVNADKHITTISEGWFSSSSSEDVISAAVRTFVSGTSTELLEAMDGSATPEARIGRLDSRQQIIGALAHRLGIFELAAIRGKKHGLL